MPQSLTHDKHTFGPDRRALLAAQLPATPADAQAQRDKQAAKLRKRLRQIDTAENAHAREIEALAHHDPNSPAVVALRSRILARFTELEEERATISKELGDLGKQATRQPDPSLLDALPTLGDGLPDITDRLAAHLYQAFDLQVLYRPDKNQVIVHAVVTPSTAAAVADIIKRSETPDAPAPATTTGTGSVEDLPPRPITPESVRHHCGHRTRRG